MNAQKFLGTAVSLLLSLGGAAAQRTALNGNSRDTAPAQELRPTHPPEPVRPVASDAALGVAPLPLNSSTWTPLGPAPIVNGQRPGGGPVSGRLTDIAAHPTDPNIIYVAAAGGGIWRTTTGGSTWTSLIDSQVTQSMGAIAIAPSNPNVIYAGTGEANNSADSNYGRGMLISTDGGTTWAHSAAGGALDRTTVSEIAVDPTNANVAYAAVGNAANNFAPNNSGIWKTTNGGVTWTNTTTTITTFEPYSSVRIDPSSPSTLYGAVGIYGGSPLNGVYRSVNGGATWTLLPNAPAGMVAGRIRIAVAASNSQVIYVSASGTGVSGSTTLGSLFKFMRSDNGGATFTDLTAGTPNYLGTQGWYDTTLIVDPSNAGIVFAGGAAGTNSLIRSATSGVTWSSITQSASAPLEGPHVDHHAAAFDADGRFLDGDDGGIYRLDSPSPVQWTHLNGDLNTIQFQGIALHPTNPEIAFGGTQDNGTVKYTGTLGWTLVEGGDGGVVRFSKTNLNRLYHQAPVASFGPTSFFRRSDDGGTTWSSKVSGIEPIDQQFYAPFVVDPNNGDRVLYGGRYVFETANGGDNWTALGPFAASGAVTAIGLAPSDANTIYAALFSGMYVSNDHGATWTVRNLPVFFPACDIQVSPTTPSTAYAVVCSLADGGKVFKTTNGGTNWVDITGNLPAVKTWSLQIDPRSPTRLFVGNDEGVFVTNNDGGSWSRLGLGLPAAQVYQLELNPVLGILGAGTHGRGLWEISSSNFGPPIALTGSALSVGATTATLSGTVNPGGSTTTAYFQYGPTMSYGITTPTVNVGTGNAPIPIGAGSISGLACNTLYHFRAVATNAGATTTGVDTTFRTATCGSTSRADVAIDFGSLGLWIRYTQGGSATWGQVHGANPSVMTAADLDGDGKSDLIVDFPGYGLWVWRNNAAWTRLHPADATSVTTGDLDGDGRPDVLVDFPGYGIWAYYNDSTWIQLHGLSPRRMLSADMDGNGRAELIVDFPGAGVWVWQNNVSWYQLHPFSTGALAAGDIDGNGMADVLIDFPGYGVWVRSNNATWFRLHPFDATFMTTGDLDGNGQADAVISFPGLGVWAWMNSGTFVQLHPFDAVQLVTGDIDGNGLSDLLLSFPGFGIWVWQNNASFEQLHPLNPDRIVIGNFDGS